MPTVLKVGPYRFFFYSLEKGEPAHIHVEQDQKTAKFWLSPVALADCYEFRSHEINRLSEIIRQHRTIFLEAWNAHFGNQA